MKFQNEKCCETAAKAKDEIAAYCENLVYGDGGDCFLYVVDSTSRLYTVDPATGTSTLIGAVGFGGIGDIAWDGAALYGIVGSQLISINTATGAGTLIGNMGASGNALEADPNTGTLYMMGGNNLYTVNKVTAVATLVGAFGGGIFSSGDLAFDSNGNLYGSFSNNNLYRIDPATAAVSLIGPFGFSFVYGLDFCNGVLYGMTSAGDLLTINTSTGAGTLVASTGIVPTFGMTSVESAVVIPCERADLPSLEPIFTLRYGEDPSDLIETKDVQCICITACNPYNNVHFNNVTVLISEILDPSGNVVDDSQFLFKPSRLVCFGDLAPCESESKDCGCIHDSCASREFLLVTRNADPGRYTITFKYCFDIAWSAYSEHTFELDVV